MLRQRVITACLLVTLLLVVIFLFPPLWFEGFVGAVLLLAGWEWSRLAGLQSVPARLTCTLLTLLLLLLSRAYAPMLRDAVFHMSLLWWLLALLLVLGYPRLSAHWNHPVVLLGAAVPVLLPGWLGLLYLRSLDSHQLLILLLLALVAAADIGAYFSGRRFGRHKLAPAVSPGKTWEGVAGGMLATCLVLWAFLPALGELSLKRMLLATLAALVLALSSVVGDLFESMLKRQRHLKDSGTLLPGHGGVLDRIDGITAAIPVFMVLLLGVGLA